MGLQSFFFKELDWFCVFLTLLFPILPSSPIHSFALQYCSCS
jgi:hypothetical protein